MDKRKMDKLGVELSLLGFGCMRFPTLENGKIDQETSEKMIDMAYKAGVNYYDTAYGYHDGESESFVGRILDKYDRNSYYLATKLPVWLVKEKADVTRIFEEQLKKLNKDHFDFYLLHSLSKEHWEKVKEFGIIEICESLRREGKIKYLGFSFHDKYDAFEEIINAYPWDFCQIQYNYMDTEEGPGERGYQLAEKLGIPLVIMEPVRGGGLANFSEDINEKFQAVDKDASVASFALRWVAGHPNVKVILSGMSSMTQVTDNISTFDSVKPWSEKDDAMIKNVVKALKSRIQNGCTGCGYCMPCPAGVDIPGNFKTWNTYHIYQNYEVVSFSWETAMEDKAKAKNCIKCGKCEALCPQHLSIRDDLEKVQTDLDQAKC
jgi:predicted aldo/keto reductase-like oxidoreductase